jgi:hypothetical protein
VLIDTHKVKVARKVLSALQKQLKAVPKGKNCREQGFLVVNYKSVKGMPTRWVAFSECRNSDSIVVFPSSTDGTDYPPNQGISEKSWENRVFFKPDEYDKAAAFCKKHLLG